MPSDTMTSASWDIARLLSELPTRDGIGDEPVYESDILGLYLYKVAADVDGRPVDGQTPHLEDEVYVVLSGRGRLSVQTAWPEGGVAGPATTHELRAGSAVFVKRGEAHCFHDVSETLEMFVVFAPRWSRPTQLACPEPFRQG